MEQAPFTPCPLPPLPLDPHPRASPSPLTLAQESLSTWPAPPPHLATSPPHPCHLTRSPLRLGLAGGGGRDPQEDHRRRAPPHPRGARQEPRPQAPAQGRARHRRGLRHLRRREEKGVLDGPQRLLERAPQCRRRPPRAWPRAIAGQRRRPMCAVGVGGVCVRYIPMKIPLPLALANCPGAASYTKCTQHSGYYTSCEVCAAGELGLGRRHLHRQHCSSLGSHPSCAGCCSAQ